MVSGLVVQSRSILIINSFLFTFNVVSDFKKIHYISNETEFNLMPKNIERVHVRDKVHMAHTHIRITNRYTGHRITIARCLDLDSIKKSIIMNFYRADYELKYYDVENVECDILLQSCLDSFNADNHTTIFLILDLLVDKV